MKLVDQNQLNKSAVFLGIFQLTTFFQPDSTENYLVGFLENHPRNEPIWHSSAIDNGNG
jgi:hypothetical protein